MRMLPKFCAAAAMVPALLLASVVSARADVIVITGVNNQGTENVLLNPANDVSVVTGSVMGLIVNFTSSSFSTLLDANPSGQATVSGGAGNEAFNQISFAGDTGWNFTRAVFNLNSAVTGQIKLTVNGINITGGVFEDTFAVDANGQNFFTVTSINGQLITRVSLGGVGNVTFEDLRQVRLGGGSIPTTAVAEPASVMLFGTGLVGVAARYRRRRRG